MKKLVILPLSLSFFLVIGLGLDEDAAIEEDEVDLSFFEAENWGEA